jgi:hypothetical protein
MTKTAGNVLCTEVAPRLQSAIPYAVPFIAPEDAQWHGHGRQNDP